MRVISLYNNKITIKMKKLTLSLLLLCMGSLLSYAALHTGTFKPMVSVGKSGQILTFTYNPEGSDLEMDKPIQASLFEYSRYAWVKKEIRLTQEGNIWKGSYTIPAGSAFIALKFYQGMEETVEHIDNNNNSGFMVTPLTAQRKKKPGAAIAPALLTMPRLGSGILNYVSDFTHSLSADELGQALKEESEIAGSDVKNYLDAYFAMQRVIKGNAFASEMAAWVDRFLHRTDLTENHLVTVQRLLRFSLKNIEKADSLSKIIVAKYPNGAYARLDAFTSNMKDPKNNKAAILAGESFLQKFPYSEWLKHPDEQEFIYYELYRMLSAAYFDTRNFKEFQNLIPQLNFKILNEMYRWNIERTYMFKSLKNDSIYMVAQPLMTEMVKKLRDGSMASNGFYTKEKALDQAQTEMEKRLMIHISLLADLGKNREALSYLDYFKAENLLKDPDLNDTHLRILENLKFDKVKIRTFMENCVSHNTVSPSMYEKLRADYLSRKEDPQKFDDYIASLKSSVMKEQLHQQIEKDLTNASLPDFDLEDLKGNIIHSTAWKDKIVVLDFWATWCRPCIRALPGMQIVVDKYANDPTVLFYFVGTMQTGNYKEKTEMFIKQEGFRLNFVYDCVNPDTGEQNAGFSKFAKLFNSSGVPRKVIVKNGVIRYTTEGYSGSASKLADELSAVIELLKSEK